MKRKGCLLYLAVLSILVAKAVSGDCVAASAVDATCAATGAIAGAVGGITCAATLGIGCFLSILGGTLSIACKSMAGSIDCSSGNPTNADIMEKLDEIVGFLEEIGQAVDEVHESVQVGFFEARYNAYINKIRSSASRYEIDVIQKSSHPDHPGIIEDTQWARDWASDVLGDGDYNCRGALDVLDEMVQGATMSQSITGRQTPSVYAVAYEQGLCSLRLYDLISSLIVQGSTLTFIAMEIRGDRMHDADAAQLQERLFTNKETFYRECSKPIPNGNEHWASWSNGNHRGHTIKRLCPTNQQATALQWREAAVGCWLNRGLVDVKMNCADYQVILTDNPYGVDNEKIDCEDTGKLNAFSGIQGREQDDHGIINALMYCYDTGSQKISNDNYNYKGWWNSRSQCQNESVVTGLEIREQGGFGIINFRARCHKLVPSKIPIEPPVTDRTTTWTSWSNGNTQGHIISKLCPENHAVEGLQWREQEGRGLIEVYMDCGLGDEIPFTRDTGFPRDGYGARWSAAIRNPKRTCRSEDNFGFKLLWGREQGGYGIIDVDMRCTDSNVWMNSSGNRRGSGDHPFPCPEGFVVSGLEVRAQGWYGIVNYRQHCTQWHF